MSLPIPIRVKGITYPSKSQAAKALGMCLTMLYNRLDRGIPLSKPLKENLRFPKPVQINGVKYKSQAAAARALGMRENTFSARRITGTRLTRPLLGQTTTRSQHR